MSCRHVCISHDITVNMTHLNAFERAGRAGSEDNLREVKGRSSGKGFMFCTTVQIPECHVAPS